MITAHLPAGYLLTSALQARAGDRSRAVLAVGLVASILPDFDFLWYFLVSDRRINHHAYVTHLPLFWLSLWAAAWAAARLLRLGRGAMLLIHVVFANLLLHMVLDSLMGSIWWLRPLSDVEVRLVHISHRYDFWPLNYILHWTFAIELAIIAAAALALRRSRHRAARRSLPA